MFRLRVSAIWLLSLDLSHKDKEILLSPTAWTTDTIVNAAQLLLRQQFPQLPGLQDVSLGQIMALNVCASEFVQILAHVSRSLAHGFNYRSEAPNSQDL